MTPLNHRSVRARLRAACLVAGLVVAISPLTAPSVVAVTDPYNGGVGCWVERVKVWKEAVKIGEVHTGSFTTGVFDYKNTNVTSIEGGVSVDKGVKWSKTTARSVTLGVSSSLPIPSGTHANVMSDFQFALEIHYCRHMVGAPIVEDYREVRLLSAYGNQVLYNHKTVPTNAFPNCRVVNSLYVAKMGAGGTWSRQASVSLVISQSLGISASISGLTVSATTKYTTGQTTSITNSYTSTKAFLVCGRGGAPQDVATVAATVQ